MVRDPRPRFAHGRGAPPRYLAQVRSAAGEVRFAGGGVPDRSYACADEAALAALLGRLLAARVPLGRDHRVDGPAELGERWLEAGRLDGVMVTLAWRGPGEWTLREWWPGVVAWREAPQEAIARLDFDPGELGMAPTA